MNRIRKDKQPIGYLVSIVQKDKWIIILLCCINIISALLSVGTAIAMRFLVDKAIAREPDRVLFWCGILFAIILIQMLMAVIYRYLEELGCANIENELKTHSFQMLLTRDYKGLSKLHTGEMMNRLTSDVETVAVGSVTVFPELCFIVSKLAGAFLYLAYLNWRFSLLLIIGFAFVTIFAVPFRKKIQGLHKEVREKDGALRIFLQEALESLLIIRSFQSEDKATDLSMNRMQQHKEARLRKKRLTNTAQFGFALVINIAYVAGLLWSGIGIARGMVSYGTLIAVQQLIGQISNPIMSVSGLLPKYYSMLACVGRLMEFDMMQEEAFDRSVDWNKIGSELKSIDMKHISFSYHNEDTSSAMIKVFDDMNFSINQGDFIAITGGSGIGKSTLLKLLLSIYDLTPKQQESRITVAYGENSRIKLDTGGRSLFAYVPQGNYLMSGTIKEAVCFWNTADAIQERIEKACQIACADEFINHLEQGYNSIIGEKGAGLSEGQLQRLAIARAVYSERPVLLLDEATSALDEETEKKVLINIRKFTNRTVVIVTHRRAALFVCNRIAKLQNGKVVDKDNEMRERVEFSE